MSKWRRQFKVLRIVEYHINPMVGWLNIHDGSNTCSFGVDSDVFSLICGRFAVKIEVFLLSPFFARLNAWLCLRFHSFLLLDRQGSETYCI